MFLLMLLALMSTLSYADGCEDNDAAFAPIGTQFGLSTCSDVKTAGWIGGLCDMLKDICPVSCGRVPARCVAEGRRRRSLRRRRSCVSCPSGKYTSGCSASADSGGSCASCGSCSSNQYRVGCNGDSAGTCVSRPTGPSTSVFGPSGSASASDQSSIGSGMSGSGSGSASTVPTAAAAEQNPGGSSMMIIIIAGAGGGVCLLLALLCSCCGGKSSSQDDYEFMRKVRKVFEDLFDTMYTINNGRFAKRTKNEGKNPKLMATARATMLAAADNTDDPTFKTVNNALEKPWDVKAKNQMITKNAFVDACVLAMFALYNHTFTDFAEIMKAITKRQAISGTDVDLNGTRVLKYFGGVDEMSLIRTFQAIWKVFDEANWAITSGACCGFGGESFLSKGSLNVWIEYGYKHDIKLFLDFVTAFDLACPDTGFSEDDFVNFAGEWASDKIIHAAKIMVDAIADRLRITSSTTAVNRYVKGVSHNDQIGTQNTEAFKLTEVRRGEVELQSPSTAGETSPGVSRMPSAPRMQSNGYGQHFGTQANQHYSQQFDAE